jgi:hypothetical protein
MIPCADLNSQEDFEQKRIFLEATMRPSLHCA